jgi:hypothetical protein
MTTKLARRVCPELTVKLLEGRRDVGESLLLDYTPLTRQQERGTALGSAFLEHPEGLGQQVRVATSRCSSAVRTWSCRLTSCRRNLLGYPLDPDRATENLYEETGKWPSDCLLGTPSSDSLLLRAGQALRHLGLPARHQRPDRL